MRALIYVPILHAEADLGTLAAEVRRRFQEVAGAEAWARRAASVEALWRGVREQLLALPIDWPATRLYQDGLPVCGREREIAADLAARGSRNHELLLELVERGAILMGTEDAAAMVRDYRRLQRLVLATQGGAPGAPGAPGALVEALRREGEAVLRERDAFIARRIESTLREGETGILFIGLLHRVHELLDGQLEVRHLIRDRSFGPEPRPQLDRATAEEARCGHGG